jgi:N-acetyl-anhydromuramyl-L-alanine amidase AmpD
MVLNLVRLWRSVSEAVKLLIISALLTVVLFKQIHSVDSRPSTISAAKTNAAAVPLKTPAPDVSKQLERQLVTLKHLYQAAPKLAVDELMRLEDLETEKGSSRVITSLNTPPQYQMDAHPSNFGDRLSRNSQGKPTYYSLLIVLHETTSAALGAVNTVLTPHPRDKDQVSYHAIIRKNGAILYLVDPLKRAYGAGNSAFLGRGGIETVQTNKRLKSSVNNFAYHISLETPSDGYHDETEHTGYSDAQYTSLTWLIAQSGVKENRITTHMAIDRAGERQDPRSFEMASVQQKNLGIRG